MILDKNVNKKEKKNTVTAYAIVGEDPTKIEHWQRISLWSGW